MGILDRFINEVSVGDIVLTWIAPEERILIGRIAGECEFNVRPERRHLAYTRKVDWLRLDITLAEYRAVFAANGEYGGIIEMTVWNATPYAAAIEQLLGSNEAPAGRQEEIRRLPVGLERDLKAAVVENIGHLGRGLSLVGGGVEQVVDAGRIDIVATDAQGNLVVVELKAGNAEPESVAQLLAYMATVPRREGQEVRGILVAHGFAQRVRYAARAIPNVTLASYSFTFEFNEIEE